MSARVLCVRVWLSCTAHAVRLCVTLRCRFVRYCCVVPAGQPDVARQCDAPPSVWSKHLGLGRPSRVRECKNMLVFCSYASRCEYKCP